LRSIGGKSGTADGDLVAKGGGGGGTWGSITGTLSDQTDLQSALDGKQATITGAATTIDTEDLTASRALVSDGSGKVAVSDVTSTELGLFRWGYECGANSSRCEDGQVNHYQPPNGKLHTCFERC
jgi:hypothetical protein